MNVEPFDWNTGEARWSIITNKYGKLLAYNLPRYNKGYANLKYQSYITEMLETDKYELFVDCGAYIGLFSQVAAHHCRYVVAYEAHPFYFGILLANMRNYRNVSCRYRFLSVKGAVPKMNWDIKGLIGLDEGTPYHIKVVSLDDESGFGHHFGTLIKLDVEGNEIDVLEGSKKLLKESYVHWIIDVHDQHGIEVEKVLEYFPNRKITMISPKVIKVEGVL